MRYLLITLFLTSLIYGQSPGESAFNLLRVNFFPRAVGLGETYVAMGDDAGSLWWNPGSAGWLEHSEAFITYHEWFMGIRDIYGGVAYATRMGVFGLGLVYSGTSGIEGWDENNNQTSELSQHSGILNFTYGRRLNSSATIGFTFKGLYDKIASETGTGFGLDLGVNYLIAENLKCGAAVKDFGTSMKYGSSSASLPTSGRIGLAYSPIKELNLLLDAELMRHTNPTIHFGSEFWIKDILALRGGLKTKPNTGPISFYTVGLGFKFQSFYFDYAFVPFFEGLGMTHRFLIGARFGELIPLGGLIVQVVDADTKQPVIAQLTITGEQVINTTTDSIDGSFQLKNQPLGMLKINVQKTKYYPKEDTTSIEKDLVKTKVISLHPIPPGEIIGLITDVKTKNVLGAKVKYQGVVSGEVIADSLVGLYRISNLDAGRYFLKVEPAKPKYFSQSCTLVVEPGKTTVRDFELIREKEVIILIGVNFETAKATLLPESYPILDRSGKILVENPDIIVEVAGHTDSRRIKTKEFPSNWELSEARAATVRDYLISKFKITPERLIAKGYAATQPIATNETADGRAQNRRTEFKVLSGTD